MAEWGTLLVYFFYSDKQCQRIILSRRHQMAPKTILVYLSVMLMNSNKYGIKLGIICNILFTHFQL